MKTKLKHDFKDLTLKFSEDVIAPHIIYIKEHSVREHTKDKPSGRTLFIVNIPPFVDKRGLIDAFSEVGKVESLNFTLKPNEVRSKALNLFIPQSEKVAFRVAYLVFEKVSSLEKALALTQLKPVNFDDHVKCGMSKWIEQYNNSVLQPHTLKESIELFMKTHDMTAKKAEEKEKKLELEDDDGWVTVTKRGKVQSFSRTDKVENKIMAKEKKNKKRKELKNFYTFQIRESKMKHIVALRQKFEEDKKKIVQIKQSRRFKPF